MKAGRRGSRRAGRRGGRRSRGLADREDADRDHHDVDAVGQLEDPAGQPRLSGGEVETDEPDGEPDRTPMKPRSLDEPSTAVTSTSDSSMIAKYDAAPISTATSASEGGEEGHQQGADGAGDEGADRGGGQRLRARPFLAILLPSMAVITDADSPGGC